MNQFMSLKTDTYVNQLENFIHGDKFKKFCESVCRHPDITDICKLLGELELSKTDFIGRVLMDVANSTPFKILESTPFFEGKNVNKRRRDEIFEVYENQFKAVTTIVDGEVQHLQHIKHVWGSLNSLDMKKKRIEVYKDVAATVKHPAFDAPLLSLISNCSVSRDYYSSWQIPHLANQVIDFPAKKLCVDELDPGDALSRDIVDVSTVSIRPTNDIICPICFLGGTSGEYRILGCGHIYHTKCLGDFIYCKLNREKREPACVLCNIFICRNVDVVSDPVNVLDRMITIEGVKANLNRVKLDNVRQLNMLCENTMTQLRMLEYNIHLNLSKCDLSAVPSGSRGVSIVNFVSAEELGLNHLLDQFVGLGRILQLTTGSTSMEYTKLYRKIYRYLFEIMMPGGIRVQYKDTLLESIKNSGLGDFVVNDCISKLEYSNFSKKNYDTCFLKPEFSIIDPVYFKKNYLTTDVSTNFELCYIFPSLAFIYPRSDIGSFAVTELSSDRLQHAFTEKLQSFIEEDSVLVLWYKDNYGNVDMDVLFVALRDIISPEILYKGAEQMFPVMLFVQVFEFFRNFDNPGTGRERSYFNSFDKMALTDRAAGLGFSVDIKHEHSVLKGILYKSVNAELYKVWSMCHIQAHYKDIIHDDHIVSSNDLHNRENEMIAYMNMAGKTSQHQLINDTLDQLSNDIYDACTGNIHTDITNIACCPICLESTSDLVPVRSGYCYHPHCLYNWIKLQLKCMNQFPVCAASGDLLVEDGGDKGTVWETRSAIHNYIKSNLVVDVLGRLQYLQKNKSLLLEELLRGKDDLKISDIKRKYVLTIGYIVASILGIDVDSKPPPAITHGETPSVDSSLEATYEVVKERLESKTNGMDMLESKSSGFPGNSKGKMMINFTGDPQTDHDMLMRILFQTRRNMPGGKSSGIKQPLQFLTQEQTSPPEAATGELL